MAKYQILNHKRCRKAPFWYVTSVNPLVYYTIIGITDTNCKIFVVHNIVNKSWLHHYRQAKRLGWVFIYCSKIAMAWINKMVRAVLLKAST